MFILSKENLRLNLKRAVAMLLAVTLTLLILPAGPIGTVFAEAAVSSSDVTTVSTSDLSAPAGGQASVSSSDAVSPSDTAEVSGSDAGGQKVPSGFAGITITSGSDLAPDDMPGFALMSLRATAYTIVYDANGGSGSMASQTVASGSSAALTANSFTRSGYAFDGWNTAADGSGTSYADCAAVTDAAAAGETLTLYAQWKRAAGIVHFQVYEWDNTKSGSARQTTIPATGVTMQLIASNNNGARTAVGSATTNIDGKATLTLELDSKNSITFGGKSFTFINGTIMDCDPVDSLFAWDGASASGGGLRVISGMTNVTQGSNVNHNAVLTNASSSFEFTFTCYVLANTNNTYTVSYNSGAGDATGSMAPSTFRTGRSYRVPGCGFTREGYEFTGWNTAADGSGTTLYAGHSLSNLASAGQTATLYAQWEPAKYTVTFIANGAKYDEQTVNHLELAAAPAADPSNAYSEFVGWYLGDAPYDFSTPVTSDLELKAHWIEHTYTVEFDANGGEGSMAPMSFTYSQEKALTASSFTRKGYTFAGWNTAADGSGTNYSDQQTVSRLTAENNATVTLYARWEALALKITGTIHIEVYEWDLTKTGSDRQTTTPIPNLTMELKGNYSDNSSRTTFGSVTTDSQGKATLVVPLYEDYQITYGGSTYTFLPTTIIDCDPVSDEYEWDLSTALNNTGGVRVLVDPVNVYRGINANHSAMITDLNQDFEFTFKCYLMPKGAEVYYVTYNHNTPSNETVGGSMTTNVTYLRGRECEVPECGFTRTGYVFSHWNTAANGSGTSYTPGQTFTDLAAANETAALYAQWERLTATVTWLNHDGSTLETDTKVPYGTIPSYDGATPTKAGNAQYSYTFTGWSPSVSAVTGNATYTAQFSQTTNNYTITWVDGNGKTIKTDSVAYGQTPSYTGSTPTKTATVQYSYTFTGWSPSVSAVTGNATYTAQFSQTTNKYTITWVDGNGKTLKTDSVAYGSTPAYSGATPTKTADAQYTYTFNNTWSPAITSVTGNATYTAQFDGALNSYVITWVDGNGDVLGTSTVAYGIVPTYNGAAPTKDATAQYTYTFNGSWSPAPSAVTGKATYTAQFDSVVNKYTVTWLNHDGSVLETDTDVPYGTTPTYDGAAPTKAGNAQYSYNFTGWTPAVSAVTGNVSYTAKFDTAVNSYTITWVNGDGKTIETDTVNYGVYPSYDGSTPTKTATAQYTYNFTGWSPEVVNVVGDATYTAQFSSTVNRYTITWVDGDGKTIETDNYIPYGSTPAYNGTTPTKTATAQYSYTFTGWDPEVVNVAGNATYTAQFDSVVNEYTVTWMVDGEVYKTETVKYGSAVPSVPNPSKDSTAQFSYTFLKWQDLENKLSSEFKVVQNVTLTALFDSATRSYTVTWVDGNDDTLAADTVEYGKTPAYTGATPTKDTDTEYIYTFNGSWSPAIVPVAGNATYTAQFDATPNEFTVTYKVDGKVVFTDTYAYGETVTVRDKYVKEGYTVTDWDKTGTFTMPAEDVEINATTTVNSYNVIYYVDGVEVYKDTYDFGETVTVRDKYVKEGYTVTDWDKTGTFTMPAEDVEINTTTTVNSYDVIYYVDGVEVYRDSYDFGETVTVRDKYVKEGYTVSDWDVTADFTMPAEDVEINATTSINSYDVIYFVDGVEVYRDIYNFGADVTVRDKYVKEGYTVTDWDKTGTFTMPAEDVEINATTTVNSYDVIYLVDGVEVYRDSYDFGETVTVRDKYVKEGYTVSDWDVTADFSMPAENVEINATTTVNSYDVIYLVDGAEVYRDTYDFGETVTVRDKFVKEGYTVSDWDVTADFTMPAEDVEINATTTVNSYDVIYKVDGVEVYRDTYDFGETVTVRDKYVKEGYTVSDWDVTADFSMPAEDVEINATTTVNNYDVIYLVDGVEVFRDSYDFGETVTVRDKYVKEGYTVSDWDVTADFSMPAEDVEINATTSINSYTITWVSEEEIYKTQIVEYGSDVPAVDNPVKASTAEYTYTFNKWQDLENMLSAEGKVVQDVTLTALFTSEAVNYKIIWVVNGLTVQEDTVAFGDNPVSKGVIAPSATKEGYSFAGWDKEIPATMPAENVTITAKWDINSYDVIYYVDGVEVYRDSYDFGETVTVRDKYVKEGYTVSDWDVTADFTMPAEDVEINATTTVNSYDVIYLVDGAEVYRDSYDFGASVTVRDTYVKEGYTVSDWDVTADFSMPAEDVEINATTTVNSYDVIYYVDGVEVYRDTYDFGETVTVRDTYVKEGYTVTDWDKTGTFSMPAKDVEINATTTVNSYDVIYKVDGVEVYRDSYDFGETVTVRDKYVKEGYTVSDWDVTADFTMPAEDVEINATTTVNSYDVIYLVDGVEVYRDTYDFGETVTVRDKYVKEGYTVSDWDVTADFSMPAEDVEINATTTVNSYDVVYKVDGVEVYRDTYDFGETVTVRDKFVKEGYTVTDWDKTGTFTMPAEDVEINATTTVNSYDVIYLVDGVEVYRDSYDFGETVTVRDKYVKEGYTVTDWDKTGTFTMPAEDVEINATTTVNSYDVIYLVDGVEVYRDSYDFGETVTVRDKFVKEGYTVTDWDKTGTFTMPAEDVEINATTTVNSYDVIYLVDGVEVYRDSYDFGETVTVRDKFVKEGYTVTDWDKTGTFTMPAEDVEINATTTVNSYDVIYYVDGVEVYRDSYDFGETVTVRDKYVKEGYTVTDWDVTADFTMPAEDVEINATTTVNSYDVIYKVDGVEVFRDTYDFGETVTVRDKFVKEGYTVTDWDKTGTFTMPAEDVEINATSTINTYTVTWIVDGSTYNTQTVEHGSDVPAVVEPSKDPTAQFTYTFNKWQDLENKLSSESKVVSDVTLTALFDSAINSYTVTWIDGNGDTLATDTVEYGQIPAYTGSTPTKDATAQYTYNFNGTWSPAIAAVVGNAEYTAQFDATVNEYTITWIDGNGDTLATDTVEYGQIPVYTGSTPTKDATAQYTYTFDGTWFPAVAAVVGDAEYTAQFDSTVNKYTVTWVNADGSVLESKTVEYGSDVPVVADPVKAPTAKYTYTFAEWLDIDSKLDDGKVVADVTLTASYTSTVNKYTVTFESVLGAFDEQSVEYDQTATEPTDVPSSAYYNVFNGWKLNGSDYDFSTPVTDHITLVADLAHDCYDNDKDGYCDGCDDCLHTVGSNGFCSEPGCNHDTSCDCVPDPTRGVREVVIYTRFADGSVAANVPVQLYVGNPMLRAVTYSPYGSVAATDANGKLTVGNDVLSSLPSGAFITAYVTGDDFEWADQVVVRNANAGTHTSVNVDPDYNKSLKVNSPDGIGFNGELTLYVAEIIKYTITWQDGDGNTLETDITVEGDTPEYNGATPTKTADAQYTYTFNGTWSPAVGAAATDQVYTAQFDKTVNKYTVTWKNHDGTVLASEELEYGTVPSYSGAAPTKTADAKYTYSFEEWTPAVTSVTGDATYTASFDATPNPYTVTFDVNGGDALADTEKTVTYSKQYGTMPVPTRTGYVFEGWYHADEEITSESTVETAADHTLTARWAPSEYTVSFRANGGTGTMADQTMTYDSSAKLSANEFVYKDHVFTGWDTDPSADTVVYADAQSVSNLTETNGDTVVLYAVWDDAVTVTASAAKGGTITPTKEIIAVGSSISLTIKPTNSRHQVLSVTVNGKAVNRNTLQKNEDGTYTLLLENVTVDTVVRVAFNCIPFRGSCSVEMSDSSIYENEVSTLYAHGAWPAYPYSMRVNGDTKYVPLRWYTDGQSGDFGGIDDPDHCYMASLSQPTEGSYVLYVEFQKYTWTDGQWVAANGIVTASHNYQVRKPLSSDGSDPDWYPDYDLNPDDGTPDYVLGDSTDPDYDYDANSPATGELLKSQVGVTIAASLFAASGVSVIFLIVILFKRRKDEDEEERSF